MFIRDSCLTVFQNDPLLSGAIAKNLLTERTDIIKPISFFQIQEQRVHIRVRDSGAGTVVADGLNDVGALGEEIFGDCPGKQRVILKDGQAVSDTVADAPFLGAFQHGFDFLNAPGRRCFLYGLFCGLPYLQRQALPSVFQD